VDARLHRVQGKAELVTELLGLLQEFHRDKLELLLRHQSGARFIAQYDVNNTYQYIVNRDEVQLTWLETAIAELGGAVQAQSEPQRSQESEGAQRAPGSKSAKRSEMARHVIEEDARDSQAFVDRWRPRVEAMPNARHARMLGLVLGETLEQKRFFDQALAGRTDLLGRRGASLGPSHGEVLPSRWIE
jgi:hypothetical protein